MKKRKEPETPMNETLNAIRNRRSHRGYKPDQLKDEDVKAIVEAAVYAPSARNQQLWHFTVVQKPETLKKMMDVVRDVIGKSDMPFKDRASDPKFNVYYEAPTVVICTIAEEAGWPELDIGAAAQNMCLAAESLGIGSIMLGMGAFALQGERGEALKKELGIPDNHRHVISVSLGYKLKPDTPTPPRKMDVISYIK
jgi:nitroreductase